MASRTSAALVVAGLAISWYAGCRSESEKPASAKAAINKDPGLPPGVDGSLLSKIREIGMRCDIDLRESAVKCKDRSFEALGEQFSQGARSPSKSLDTIAFVLKEADEKMVTVGAELLHAVFRNPPQEKEPKAPSRETALALIAALGKLPGHQAVDAAPAIIQEAMKTGTDKELYAIVEAHPYKRLQSRSYKFLMASGGMRAWSKVQESAKSESIELALAALDAPSMMRDKTPEQRAQICEWYQGLTSDPRPVVVTRASGYLIACGPTYIEPILAADEERLKDKTLTKMPLGSYREMCTELVAASGPTAEQCVRLKKMLTTVLEETRFEPSTRIEALALLTVNFIDQEMLTLARKYTKDKVPLVAQRAEHAVTQLEEDLAAMAHHARAQPQPQ